MRRHCARMEKCRAHARHHANMARIASSATSANPRNVLARGGETGYPEGESAKQSFSNGSSDAAISCCWPVSPGSVPCPDPLPINSKIKVLKVLLRLNFQGASVTVARSAMDPAARNPRLIHFLNPKL